jgi:hypothetical protein
MIRWEGHDKILDSLVFYFAYKIIIKSPYSSYLLKFFLTNLYICRMYPLKNFAYYLSVIVFACFKFSKPIVLQLSLFYIVKLTH